MKLFRNFVANTRQLARKRGLNSVSLGKMAGVSQKTAHRFLYVDNEDSSTTTLDTVEHIAAALGADPLAMLSSDIDADEVRMLKAFRVLPPWQREMAAKMIESISPQP